MSVRRFGVSLEDEILVALDNYVETNGFSNRSQAIRFLVEKNVGETKWMCNHVVAGVIVLMFDQHRQEIITQLMEIESEYHHLILASTQNYLDADFCLHIVTVKGKAHELTEVSDRLISIKGLKHGKLVMSRAD